MMDTEYGALAAQGYDPNLEHQQKISHRPIAYIINQPITQLSLLSWCHREYFYFGERLEATLSIHNLKHNWCTKHSVSNTTYRSLTSVWCSRYNYQLRLYTTKIITFGSGQPSTNFGLINFHLWI